MTSLEAIYQIISKAIKGYILLFHTSSSTFCIKLVALPFIDYDSFRVITNRCFLETVYITSRYPSYFLAMTHFLLLLMCFPLGQEFQRKLSQLTPEQKRLTEKLKNMALNNMPGQC